jgi:hypothetical protein
VSQTIVVPDQWKSSQPSYRYGYQDGYGGRAKSGRLKTELARRAYDAGYTAGQIAKYHKASGADEEKRIRGPLIREEEK